MFGPRDCNIVVVVAPPEGVGGMHDRDSSKGLSEASTIRNSDRFTSSSYAVSTLPSRYLLRADPRFNCSAPSLWKQIAALGIPTLGRSFMLRATFTYHPAARPRRMGAVSFGPDMIPPLLCPSTHYTRYPDLRAFSLLASSWAGGSLGRGLKNVFTGSEFSDSNYMPLSYMHSVLLTALGLTFNSLCSCSLLFAVIPLMLASQKSSS
ncbi:hypothetical protein CY34DRAFT_12444 [Suillus luteus UH-Slu-Lm8-n1]|uniref:Uncharacterized protein n=1 Tax=Suillus luteus UH-Slu-Lm8-n1 TaxID=930992 RepID=A0A0D0AWU0_9AGAM|nr:hypothetical protein CY34DRAFT_12444 [Suillus luteus UH-Slu-Lm8-n1]